VISFAARDVGERLGAKALVAFTQSGDTVRRLARLHTPLPLLAFTPVPEVQRQLALTWGTETFLVDPVTSTDEMIRQVDTALLELGRYSPGDLVVIVAGSPPHTVGSTNLIHVHRIGTDDSPRTDLIRVCRNRPPHPRRDIHLRTLPRHRQLPRPCPDSC
jgi:pyruvate kinase